MSKYSGTVGYAITTETEPGIWEESIVERRATLEVKSNHKQVVDSGQINDNLRLSTTVSMIFDPFAHDNYSFIRYVTYLNVKWKVVDLNVMTPRLHMTLGGKYNG